MWLRSEHKRAAIENEESKKPRTIEDTKAIRLEAKQLRDAYLEAKEAEHKQMIAKNLLRIYSENQEDIAIIVYHAQIRGFTSPEEEKIMKNQAFNQPQLGLTFHDLSILDNRFETRRLKSTLKFIVAFQTVEAEVESEEKEISIIDSDMTEHMNSYKASLRKAKADRAKKLQENMIPVVGKIGTLSPLLKIITDYEPDVKDSSPPTGQTEINVYLKDLSEGVMYENVFLYPTQVYFTLTPSGNISYRYNYKSPHRLDDPRFPYEEFRGIIDLVNVNEVRMGYNSPLGIIIAKNWGLDEWTESSFEYESWNLKLERIKALTPIMLALIKLGNVPARDKMREHYHRYKKLNIFSDQPELQDEEKLEKLFKSYDQLAQPREVLRKAQEEENKNVHSIMYNIWNLNPYPNHLSKAEQTLKRQNLVNEIKMLEPLIFMRVYNMIISDRNSFYLRLLISRYLKPVMLEMIRTEKLTYSETNHTSSLGKLIDLHIHREKQGRVPTSTREYVKSYFLRAPRRQFTLAPLEEPGKREVQADKPSTAALTRR